MSAKSSPAAWVGTVIGLAVLLTFAAVLVGGFLWAAMWLFSNLP